jgi:hypothetical protein
LGGRRRRGWGEGAGALGPGSTGFQPVGTPSPKKLFRTAPHGPVAHPQTMKNVAPAPWPSHEPPRGGSTQTLFRTAAQESLVLSKPGKAWWHRRPACAGTGCKPVPPGEGRATRLTTPSPLIPLSFRFLPDLPQSRSQILRGSGELCVQAELGLQMTFPSTTWEREQGVLEPIVMRPLWRIPATAAPFPSGEAWDRRYVFRASPRLRAAPGPGR